VISVLPPVTVTAPSLRSIDLQLKNRSTQFSSEDINSTAGTAGDLSRYITILPSAVASISEGYDNTLYIQGGRPAEVVFVVDGVDFDNINHFSDANSSGGPIGFINSDFINIVNFYAGNSPAEYPSRLSSVIDIKLKNGSLTNYKGSGGVKWTGGMLSFEGPITQESSSIIGSARYIDFSTLSKFANNNGIPKLGDIYLKLLFLYGNKLTCSLSGLFSYNHFTLKYPSVYTSFTDNELHHTNVTSEIKHIVQGGGGFTIRYDNKISQEVIFGVSFRDGKRYDSIGDYHSEFFKNRFVQNPVWENNTYKTYKMIKYKAQVPIGNNDSVTAGTSINITRLSMKLGDYSQYYLGSQTAPLWLKKSDTADVSLQGTDFGCFVEFTLQKWCLATRTGIRYDYYNFLDNYSFSPSILVDISLPVPGIFSVQYGVYHQFPSEIPAILFNVCSFGRSPDKSPRISNEASLLKQVKPYRCHHYGIGYKTSLFNHFFLRSDFYYKWYDREFLYNNPYTISVVTTGAPGEYAIADQSGKRKSTGIEVMVNNGDYAKSRFSIAGSLFSTQNRYSDGNWYNDWSNVGYTLSLSHQRSFLNHHHISVTATAMGGRPYTRISSDIYHSSPTSTWLKERLDRIFYVNIRYAFNTTINQIAIEGNFEILNLFNAQPALDYRFNGERYIKITPFGITPILGIQFSL
jgi:hypothetical protein